MSGAPEPPALEPRAVDPSPPALDRSERAAIVGERVTVVQELLSRRAASGVVIGSRRGFAWLTAGGRNHVVSASEAGVAPLLVTSRGCVALAPINEAARVADEEVAGLPIELRSVPWHAPDAGLAEARRIAGHGPTLVDESSLEPDLMPIRARLHPAERERMRWLGTVADATLAEALAGVIEGTTEDELAAATLASLAARGVAAPVVLVAADERITRYRHPLPSGQPILRRVMLVIVAERWGLHVAATRIRELEPPGPALAARLTASQRVLEALHRATRPGETLGAVLAAGQAAYRDEGFPDEWRLHHQGGLIGYAGRERIATPGDVTRLETGMAVAWNPSIAGAKAEATHILEHDGLETVV